MPIFLFLSLYIYLYICIYMYIYGCLYIERADRISAQVVKCRINNTINNDKINPKKSYALHCALQEYWENIALIYINCSVFSILNTINIIYFSFSVIHIYIYIYIFK